MYTVETAIDSLKKFDIRENDIENWENELNLDIPVDARGRKQYSPHHINLFKNVKKHLALGRTLNEIGQIVALPPLVTSQPMRPIESFTNEPIQHQTAEDLMKDITGGEQPAQAPQVKEAIRPQQTPHANSKPIEITRPTATEQNEMNNQAQATEQAQDIQQTAKKFNATPKPAQQAAETTEKIGSAIPKSPYASAPKRPIANTGQGALNVVNLVQQLTKEKDQLYKKLLETEKLNSHLYSANSLYHRKVKDMGTAITSLKEQKNENENFKLLDDKDKLHKQLIASEKLNQYKEVEIERLNRIIEADRKVNDQLTQKIDQLTETINKGFDSGKFCGNWMETGNLVEIAYDNFGINIESERVRLFRISEIPTRLYGNTAIITTAYEYETNNLWKRNETLTVALTSDNALEGELTVEYILDGVPVAKALYQVVCRKQ